MTALGSSPQWPHAARPNLRYISADTTQPGSWQQEFAAADAVVNLTGRTIFKRWTADYKQQIRDSRILTTRNIVDALPAGSDRVLCSTSAVGYYGDRGDDILDENAAAGDGFLADLAIEWEQEAAAAAAKGIRVAVMRFGIVLGANGGAMARMLPAFRMFAGGPLGDGRQWFPWIHLQDVLSAVQFLLETSSLNGPFNFSAPNPVRNRQLATALGQVLNRPAFMPAPRAMLRLMLGEVAGSLVESQRAVPQNLLDSGFRFQFPEIDAALRHIVDQPSDTG